MECCRQASSSDEPEVILDPAKLTAQLSELLELYLARAKEALAEEQMSSREAVACARQVAGMLEDAQSGKLRRVDARTEWPRLEFTPAAQTQRRAGRAHPPGSSPAGQAAPCARQPAAPPILSLEDAVSAVCQADPETAELEPWALLLTRINRLTQRLAADLEEWKAACAEPLGEKETELPEGPASGRPASAQSKMAAGRPPHRVSLQPESRNHPYPNGKTPIHQNPRGP